MVGNDYMSKTIVVPIWIGDTIYKICPKCNEEHNGNCDHCAWSGCSTQGCDVGVNVYPDGSCYDGELQIIKGKVYRNNFMTICDWFGIMYFDDIDKAKEAMTYYDDIRKEPDKFKRVKRFEDWFDSNSKSIKFISSHGDLIDRNKLIDKLSERTYCHNCNNMNGLLCTNCSKRTNDDRIIDCLYGEEVIIEATE